MSTPSPNLPSVQPPKPLVRRNRPNQYVDRLTNAYIESMGKLDDLKIALSRSNSAKAQRFLTLLVTPRQRQVSVTRLARMAGVESADLFDIFRDYYMSQGMMEMVKALPALSKDIVDDSRSTMIDCPRCDGFGQVKQDTGEENPPLVTCPRCDGVGKARKSGDPDARKLLAETVGLIKRGGAPGVSININAVGVESIIDEVEKLEGRRSSIPIAPPAEQTLEAQFEPA